MDRKKLIISAAILVGVTASGYAASQALFSDTEVATDSTFTVGTLDLDVDGNNGTDFDNFSITNIGADGTVNGGKTWVINNTGSLPGELTFSMADLDNLENGCNEPEALVDASCDTPGSGQGDLGDAITTTVTLDGLQVISSDLATANVGAYASQWDTNAGTVVIPAGGSATVVMNWATDPSAYGNEIQSDSLTFDLAFSLVQVDPTP